jgi:uncharacterized protein HemY
MNGRTDRLREATWYVDRLWVGRHHRAILALCSRAMTEDGEDPAILMRRARSLLATGRRAEAERDVLRASSLAPDSAAPYVLLCEIALRQHDLDRAELLITRALRLEPLHPRARELEQVIVGWGAAAAAHSVGTPDRQLPPPRPTATRQAPAAAA